MNKYRADGVPVSTIIMPPPWAFLLAHYLGRCDWGCGFCYHDACETLRKEKENRP